ncbi:MAG: cytochrome B [Alphaproteobacteria bacterium HGW-Alphaproteobacteria-8]|jgi:cytochrome b|nr:MAG: cytochrome B [Alphaproteobacteria bacterium HGW-Alphaproteobacteria-8]
MTDATSLASDVAEPVNGRAVRVWDPLVRASHWLIAASVLLNGLLLDEEGAAHIWIGYGVIGVLSVRLLWGLIGPAPARFASFPPSVSEARAHVGAIVAGVSVPHVSHNPLGALMVYALWFSLAAICVTGLMMESLTFFGVQWVEDIHEFAANAVLLMAAGHLAGVALETRLSGVNLVRAMVTGVKVFPNRRR